MNHFFINVVTILMISCCLHSVNSFEENVRISYGELKKNYCEANYYNSLITVEVDDSHIVPAKPKIEKRGILGNAAFFMKHFMYGFIGIPIPVTQSYEDCMAEDDNQEKEDPSFTTLNSIQDDKFLFMKYYCEEYICNREEAKKLREEFNPWMKTFIDNNLKGISTDPNYQVLIEILNENENINAEGKVMGIQYGGLFEKIPEMNSKGDILYEMAADRSIGEFCQGSLSSLLKNVEFKSKDLKKLGFWEKIWQKIVNFFTSLWNKIKSFYLYIKKSITHFYKCYKIEKEKEEKLHPKSNAEKNVDTGITVVKHISSVLSLIPGVGKIFKVIHVAMEAAASIKELSLGFKDRMNTFIKGEEKEKKTMAGNAQKLGKIIRIIIDIISPFKKIQKNKSRMSKRKFMRNQRRRRNYK